MKKLKIFILFLIITNSIQAQFTEVGINYSNINTLSVEGAYRNIYMSLGTNGKYRFPKASNPDKVISWEYESTGINHVSLGYTFLPFRNFNMGITPLVGGILYTDNIESCDNMYKYEHEADILYGGRIYVGIYKNLNITYQLNNIYMSFGLSYSINTKGRGRIYGRYCSANN